VVTADTGASMAHGGHGIGPDVPGAPEDDAELQLASALGGIPIEQLRLQQKMRRAQGLMGAPAAGGRQVGNIFVASSPLEHLASAMSRYQGNRMADQAEQEYAPLAQQAVQGQQAMLRSQRAAQQRSQEREDAVAMSREIEAANAARLRDAQMAETERHNRAVEARPPSMPVILGAGGEQYRLDPRDPAAPAIPVVDPRGRQLVKPAGGGHGGGMAEVAERKRVMLSDGQVKTIAQYDSFIDALKDIQARKSQIDTGPVAARRNRLAGAIGLDDPQVSSFRATVGDSLATYIRGLSGAAVSDKERAFLLGNVPKLEDNDAVFSAKLNAVMERLQRLREMEIDLFGRQGKDVSGFGDGGAPAAAPAADPLGIR
jgi:hypothetical protein